MTGHVTGFVDAYVLGELDEQTTQLVHDHLEECPLCRTDVNDARAVLDVLPFSLELVEPPKRVLQNIMSGVAANPAASPRDGWLRNWRLAAAFALALLGDGILGVKLATSNRPPAPRTVTAAPARVAAKLEKPSPERTGSRADTATSKVPKPAATGAFVGTRPSMPTPPKALAQAAVAVSSPARSTALSPVRPPSVQPAAPSLERAVAARDRAIARLRVLATQDAGRIAQLGHRLVLESARKPSPEAGVIAALQTGRVYSINGVVGDEAWQGTVVQATPNSNALLLTRAPSAPSGIDYHVWVLRNGQTYDAGAISPRAETTLEMPMPLVPGDIVAFSRGPKSSGNKPTQPYLMELPITR